MAPRAAKSLTASLVAELEDPVTGRIAFSPVTISDVTTNGYGLLFLCGDPSDCMRRYGRRECFYHPYLDPLPPVGEGTQLSAFNSNRRVASRRKQTDL